MNPFHFYLYVLDNDLVHLCDTRSARQRTLCGLTLPGERTDQIIDSPGCLACEAVHVARMKIHPTDAPWSRRLQRKLDRYLKNLGRR
jgi:hypothetical protein